MPMKVLLAEPRGFCGGVRRALQLLETLLAEPDHPPIYVLHELVHNNFVVKDLEARGVHTVETLNAVPDGVVVVFSAHGTALAVEEEAKRRNLRIVDATCPLVRELHREAALHAAAGETVFLIGHKSHPEVIGTAGRAPEGAILPVESAEEAEHLPEPRLGQRFFYLTQTTLSPEETDPVLAVLRRRFPGLSGRSGICYATGQRQEAVRELLSRKITHLVVIGSPRSSNSNRLCEVARRAGIPARLVDAPMELAPEQFPQDAVIGLTAGASAPETLVKQALARLTGNAALGQESSRERTAF